VAAQDHALSSYFFKKTTVKDEIENECQLCKEYEETFEHLTSGCPILAKNECIIRHDKICTHLRYSKCKKLGIQAAQNWYSHIPKAVHEHEDITVLWKQGVQADRF
jgi:hypothetical protein